MHEVFDFYYFFIRNAKSGPLHHTLTLFIIFKLRRMQLGVFPGCQFEYLIELEPKSKRFLELNRAQGGFSWQKNQ